VAKVDIAPARRARAAAVLTVVASVVVAVWLDMRQPHRIRLAGLPSVDMAGLHPDFETF
jgi:hypothetical protein